MIEELVGMVIIGFFIFAIVAGFRGQSFKEAWDELKEWIMGDEKNG